MITFKFKFGEYMLKFERYSKGGGVAMRAVTMTGEPAYTITVNVPEKLPEGCVAVKDYSENEGIMDALIEAGIIGSPIDLIFSGYVIIPVCPLLVNPE